MTSSFLLWWVCHCCRKKKKDSLVDESEKYAEGRSHHPWASITARPGAAEEERMALLFLVITRPTALNSTNLPPWSLGKLCLFIQRHHLVVFFQSLTGNIYFSVVVLNELPGSVMRSTQDPIKSHIRTITLVCLHFCILSGKSGICGGEEADSSSVAN